jgi:serine/threonine-protein phosphatase 2A activator
MDSTQNTKFVKPVRKILTKEDLERFLSSPVHSEIIEFTLKLNDSVKGMKNSDEVKVNPVR